MTGTGNARRDDSGGGLNNGFEKWMMGIMATLIAVGVAGVWNMSTSVARLEERLANWVVVSERLFAQIAADSVRQREGLESVRDRVNNLERVVADSLRNNQSPQNPQPPDTGRFALPPATGGNERRR
jgi:hypothetical protein